MSAIAKHLTCVPSQEEGKIGIVAWAVLHTENKLIKTGNACMAEAGKTSFLGSISPWSKASTTPPKTAQRELPAASEDGLKPTSGIDHIINARPSPSLRKYPKDCPPLKAKWFYAVDIPKRKPFGADSQGDKDKVKPRQMPKKLVPFSTTDSQAIEVAYQKLDTDEPPTKGESKGEPKMTSTRVPVNEDFLFDVHVEKRELEPAYWLGPVYDVRRGTWFFVEGSNLRPCEENLANQLEEGYLKIAPWRRPKQPVSKAASLPRSRPESVVGEVISGQKPPGTATPTENHADSADIPLSNVYRLFGAHMSTTVTYMDATVAYLAQDDFMSRVSSTVYERFGSYGGTKVVRGWSDSNSKPVEGKVADTKEKPKTILAETEDADESQEGVEKPPRRNALQRQLSSLAGLDQGSTSEMDAQKEADEEQAREMEDAREKDGDDQSRQIDHLVLVTHGIGQRLGLRLDSINFIHDVNTLRKTMKAVYESAPDLQAISGDPKNCRVQVLPICWRHLLDFPKQSLKNNRKEYDLGDAGAAFDDEYPSLQDITVEGVPAVRNLITDLAMDVLLYQSAYREHIASIVRNECNRVYHLFKKRTGFNGSVSLCGHSLGSAIVFDILCRQEETRKSQGRRKSSRTGRDPPVVHDHNELKLDFECNKFFALGSPIALFQMLKGRTIAGREAWKERDMPVSPFDLDPVGSDPFDAGNGRLAPPNVTKDLIPITQSSPKCDELFNIFHPTDPIAYRIEPLISPAMAQLKPQPLPFTKKGLFAAPGIANISQRVGQQVMSGWYSLTSGVASTLINRSLGITGEEQALPQDRAKAPPPADLRVAPVATTAAVTTAAPAPAGSSELAGAASASSNKQQEIADQAAGSPSSEHVPTLIEGEIETLYSGFQKRHDRSRALTGESEREEAKIKALNRNGRVDYAIQEGIC
ncbi:hypothetical protein DV738_g1781, partial [Chaetothyriales sp. CBS 135597]